MKRAKPQDRSNAAQTSDPALETTTVGGAPPTGSASDPALEATHVSVEPPAAGVDSDAALEATHVSVEPPAAGADSDAALEATHVSVAPPLAAPTAAGGESAQLSGRRLHHFRLDVCIGSGGMGSVYRAHDLSLDREVALKIIGKGNVSDPDLQQRFTREARAQARLSHANVVPIYYIGEQDGLYFMAMELLDGEPLDAPLMRGETVPWAEALEYVIAAAEALATAQRRGFIHRDIKPSNLLRDESGVLKVADFGLAKSVEATDTSAHGITQRGMVVGSPLYMAPEQGRGEPVDHRADIYSLGATFYHLLVGAPPFTASSAMGVITKHITDPLPALPPHVSPSVTKIIRKMMAKSPDKRYADYDALLDALREARPKPLEPAGFWVRAVAMSIDLVLVGVLRGLIGDIAWAIYAVYLIGGWWLFGQTVGKAVLKLKVRTKDGMKPSLLRCVGRFAALHWGVLAILGVVMLQVGVLSLDSPLQGKVRSVGDLVRAAPELIVFIAGYGLLGLAYLGSLAWTGFTRHKRAPHDLICGTRVVYDLKQVVAPPSPVSGGTMPPTPSISRPPGTASS